jgi:RNA polymerase sigma-70 factor (ECF subfamily)
MSRCGDKAVAEDLTSETFMAVTAGPADAALSVARLAGVARHKLVDHWRWQARQRRLLQAVEELTAAEDSWDVELDRVRAPQVLSNLPLQYRAALRLRYLDGLSVPEAAVVVERTVAASEALLVRARCQFRRAYEESSDV